MKKFPVFLLCLLFLTLCRVNAQEVFAPLISENCVAFVHVDFSSLETDKIKGTLQKAGEDLLTELHFDERSREATLRELNVELEKLDMLARPVFDTITKELGIKEFAVIIDLDIIATNRGVGVIALPWKNKTEKQLDTLKKLIGMTGNPYIVNSLMPMGDLLLLPIADGPETVYPIVSRWLENETSSPTILEALKSVEGNEIKIVAAIPPALRDMMKSAPLPSDVPVQVRNLALFAAQKINWASAGGSFSELFGGETSKNADVLLTVKTAKRSDAVMLRGMLEQLIEFGINAAQFGMQQNPQTQEMQIPPLAFQFAKGLLRTMLPDIEEDKLIFRSRGLANAQSAVAAAGIGAALLLPGIKAARGTAERMQCTNNMKQIVLAIHNYHDARGELPPLYTVDKDGKPLHSWRVLLLPYIEQTALYEQIRLDEPWDSEHNKQFHNRFVSVYQCPLHAGRLDWAGRCPYSAIAGEGFAPANKAGDMTSGETFARLQDGTSNTIAIIEVKEPFCWMDPTADVTLDELAKGINQEGRVGSYHRGGCNVGLFDGGVHFFSETMDSASLRALGDCDDGIAVRIDRGR